MDSTCSDPKRKSVRSTTKKAEMGMITPSPFASFREKLRDKKVQATLTMMLGDKDGCDDVFVTKPD